MIGYLRKWFRYRRLLSRAEGIALDSGYRISSATWEQMRREARAEAGLPSTTRR